MNYAIRQYMIVTGNYWAFTLTDSALRMLVVLYFYQQGFGALQIATLFIFYEAFGIVTNLVGGWLGARLGLNKTMNAGLFLQIVALLMLALPSGALSVAWVMLAQALSGIAKDLNKMSAKSAIKQLVPSDQNQALFRWVALLTGSKNTLKGVGFFLGGALLTLLEFKGAIYALAALLTVTWLFSLFALGNDLGKAKSKPKFRGLFAKNQAINALSAARFFLFGARDIWFVIALPVYLASELGWLHWQVGAFLASWIIGYGFIQSLAPYITSTHIAAKTALLLWASVLTAIPVVIALLLSQSSYTESILIIGLLAFGAVFALNSSLHSYLIVRFAKADGVSLDIGFYYMANAAGRLVGTLLSGWIYQQYGLQACLYATSVFIGLSLFIAMWLPKAP